MYLKKMVLFKENCFKFSRLLRFLFSFCVCRWRFLFCWCHLNCWFSSYLLSRMMLMMTKFLFRITLSKYEWDFKEIGVILQNKKPIPPFGFWHQDNVPMCRLLSFLGDRISENGWQWRRRRRWWWWWDAARRYF